MIRTTAQPLTRSASLRTFLSDLPPLFRSSPVAPSMIRTGALPLFRSTSLRTFLSNGNTPPLFCFSPAAPNMIRTRFLPSIRCSWLRASLSKKAPLSTASASASAVDVVAHQITSLLSHSSDWHHVICNSDLPGKLTPSLVNSVMRTSWNVDPIVLFDFFHYSTPQFPTYEKHQVDSFCILALKLFNANLRQIAGELIEEMIDVHHYIDVLRSIKDMFPVRGEIFNVAILDEIIMAYSKSWTYLPPQILLLMKDYNLAPTERCCNQLLNDMFKAGKYDDIWLVREFMTWAPGRCDLDSYSILIKTYFKLGDPWSAKELFYEMEKKGFKPGEMIYNTMIFNLSKTGFIDDALQLKNQMLQNSFSLDSDTCSRLIVSLCRKKGAREAKGLLDEMRGCGVPIKNIVYKSLMEGFIRQGDSNEVLVLKQEMEANGIQVGKTTYETLIRGFCHLGDMEGALAVINEMVQNRFQ